MLLDWISEWMKETHVFLQVRRLPGSLRGLRLCTAASWGGLYCVVLVSWAARVESKPWPAWESICWLIPACPAHRVARWGPGELVVIVKVLLAGHKTQATDGGFAGGLEELRFWTVLKCISWPSHSRSPPVSNQTLGRASSTSACLWLPSSHTTPRSVLSPCPLPLPPPPF